jgi:hypothetical protein
MIVIEKNGHATDAVVWSQAPTIYMDNWALNMFATDARGSGAPPVSILRCQATDQGSESPR